MEESRFIQYKNKSIHYRIFGEGKPVMLLHGFGEDGNIWNDVTNLLKEDFLFIIPDLPGSGRSEMLEGNISIDDYVEVIKAILDNEIIHSHQSFPFPPLSGEIEGAVMIGHSMGGYITLAFAEKYPSYLNGFGLFHSSAFADDEEKKQIRLKAIDFIEHNGAFAFLKTSIPNLFAGDKHLKEIDDMIESGKNFTGEALVQYYHAMINRPDRTEVLRSFKKPVLFVIGEKDTAVPLNVSLQQCHLPDISHIHILENAAHMGMLEEKNKSKYILSSFLQNIYDSATP